MTIDRNGVAHRPAGSTGGGQFATHTRTAPTGALTEPRAVETAAQAIADGLRPRESDQSQTYSSAECNALMAEAANQALQYERWRNTPPAGSLSAVSLDDAAGMAGDELRSLTPRQLAHLESKAVRVAHRLAAYLVETGVARSPEVGQLEIIDFSAVTEKNVTDMWLAARDQIGARGVLRTKSDFIAHLEDHAAEGGSNTGLSEQQIDRAWNWYRTSGTDAEYEDAVAAIGEYERWSLVTQEALQHAGEA